MNLIALVDRPEGDFWQRKRLVEKSIRRSYVVRPHGNPQLIESVWAFSIQGIPVEKEQEMAVPFAVLKGIITPLDSLTFNR